MNLLVWVKHLLIEYKLIIKGSFRYTFEISNKLMFN